MMSSVVVVVVVVYHAGLAESILHHQHVRQAECRAGLQLPQGDFQGGGRHPGQRLEGRGGGKISNQFMAKTDQEVCNNGP